MKSSISQSWYWIGLAVPFAANRKSIIRQQEKNIAFSAPCVCDRHAERLNVRIFAIYRCNGIAIICFVNLSVIFVFGPFWWQTQWFADSAHDFRLATDTLLVDRMLPFASSNDSIESLDTESTDYDDDEKTDTQTLFEYCRWFRSNGLQSVENMRVATRDITWF